MMSFHRFSLALGTVLLVAMVHHGTRTVLQERNASEQANKELKGYAKLSDWTDEPEDVEDGDLYRDPSKRAVLGSVKSSDLFADGMKTAKRQENEFKLAVQTEKEKSIAADLASLRKSMLSETPTRHHHRLTAASVWRGIRSTAGALVKGLSDERHIKEGDESTATRGRSTSRSAGSASSRAAAVHSSRRAKREDATDNEKRSRAALVRENERLKQRLKALSSLAQAKGTSTQLSSALGANKGSKAREQQLREVGEAVTHIVHLTRPGMEGGVVCAPPFCNGGDLPAVLPGDSAATSARTLWSNQQM